MKKFLLTIAAVFLTLGAMAQNAVELTFTRNGNGADVKVEGKEGVTASITATSASNAWNTGGAMANRTEVLCQNTNTSQTTQSSPITYTLTIEGLNTDVTGVAYTHIAVNSSGNLQPSNDTDIRHCNFNLEANGNTVDTITDENIWIPSGSTEKTITFDGLAIEANGTLTIKLTLYKGTTNGGCFYGLTKITVNLKETVEEQPALISRTGWGVTASSQETSGDPGQATNAIDGNNGTFWHTVYAETYPHWIEFDMTKTYTVYSFDYVSRFDNTNSNGNILEYELYISNSAMNGNYENATLAASGTFVYGQGVNHLIELDSPVAGRYVALVAKSGTRGNWAGNAATNAANCAEFNVYGIEVPAETNEAAKAALAEKIAQAEALLTTITIGDGVGEYSCGSYTEAEVESLLGSVKAFYDSITSDTEVASIEAYIEFINETIALCSLNMPVAGKYYRFYCAAGQRYLASDISNDRLEMQTTDENIEDQIFLCAQNGDDLAIVSYSKGQAINAYNLDNIATMSAAVFSATYNNVHSQYNIKVGNRYIYGQGNTQNNHIDSGTGNPNSNGYNWIVEEVTTLPVTISAAGWATFYAPVAVEVAEGVKAYAVTINGNWATLNDIEGGVIPANTGVVLQGVANTTYNFAVTNTTATVDSDLTGTVAATYITDDAYVLTADATCEEGVCFGKASKNQQNGTAWKNNSHKAYLPVPANAEGVKSYSFRFPGTTGVENVVVENEVKAIYDLTGRRVSEITEAGIYIIGGRKVLVK